MPFDEPCAFKHIAIEAYNARVAVVMTTFVTLTLFQISPFYAGDLHFHCFHPPLLLSILCIPRRHPACRSTSLQTLFYLASSLGFHYSTTLFLILDIVKEQNVWNPVSNFSLVYHLYD